MPEITKILTDDQGTITHLVTMEADRVTVEELAQALAEEEKEYYITFDEGKRYSITIVAEDGHLEPTVDDPDGVHTIWDLPTEEDPAEANIEEMFESLTDMGEAEPYTFDGPDELSGERPDRDQLNESI